MRWIDPFQSGWLDWLRDQSLANTGSRSLLLLDGAFLPGLYRRLAQGRLASRACCALFDGLPGCNEDALAVSPVVVEYRPTDMKLHDVLDATNGRPMVTLIKTSESAQQLAARLAQWCVIDADGCVFNFRFPDTRRLPAIARTLTEGQRAQLLGPATEWHCVNRFGRWESLPDSEGSAPSEGAPKLTAAQFASLVADSEPDEILAILEPDIAASVRCALPSWRFVRTQRVLAEMNRRGLDDTQERIAGVARGLGCGEQQFEREFGLHDSDPQPPAMAPGALPLMRGISL